MSDYIRMRLDSDLKEKVRKYSKEKGMNISTLIRMLLIKEMQENGKQRIV